MDKFPCEIERFYSSFNVADVVLNLVGVGLYDIEWLSNFISVHVQHVKKY